MHLPALLLLNPFNFAGSSAANPRVQFKRFSFAATVAMVPISFKTL